MGYIPIMGPFVSVFEDGGCLMGLFWIVVIIWAIFQAGATAARKSREAKRSAKMAELGKWLIEEERLERDKKRHLLLEIARNDRDRAVEEISEDEHNRRRRQCDELLKQLEEERLDRERLLEERKRKIDHP